MKIIIYNNFTFSCEKSKTVSLASSITKNIVTYCSRFPVKLICCIPFASASSTPLHLHQVLHLLLSSYNTFKNNYSLAHNQFCNHLLELLKFFKYYLMLLNYFLLVDQKWFLHQSKRYNVLFL